MGTLQLSSGSLFANRFEIDRPAGSGGMGAVYRARDRYSGEVVALKLLHSGSDRADEGERFAREAQILAELPHPSIVAHVAHGQTPEGQRFLAMEWLEGEDLGQRLLRGPLPLRDCLLVLERVAQALALAHGRGIIHRDIKPTNIFLVHGEVTQLKLLDFGIARRIVTSRAMTRTGMVVGTPEYMAPEQARGVRDLTPAADLFSLGCVLYECLTGQPPFVADHIAAVLVRILFEEPAPIEHRRPGVPASVAELLHQLLTKDPMQRLPDASALQKVVASLGEQPEPVLAATMASGQVEKPSFASQEQSLFSVILAAPPEEEMGIDPTLRPADLLQPNARQTLSEALASLNLSANFLANGALVVTVPATGSAMDQATQAARAALLIKERWPAAIVSVATGRGAIRGGTAVGEVVERAARSLKTGSQPALSKAVSGVLIDALTAKLVVGRFVTTGHPAGALLLSEEKDVDASRPLLGKPTPCVGREAELGILDAQLTSCIDESEGRVVLVTAPPGAGKSRLRHEFLRRIQQRSEAVTVLVGRGDLMSAGAPYGILGAGIRQLCGLSGGEPLPEQRERVRSRIARYIAAPEQERVVLFVGELCNVPFPEQGLPMLQTARQEPKVMRDCVRRAALDWLSAESAAAPVVMVFDDLQWGDALTVSVLEEALREQSGAPLLVLAFARPEVHTTFPKLWQGHKVQEVPLKGLSKKACERLIQQVLGKDLAADAVARVVEQSAGNALFLEELIRSLADGKAEEQPETVLAMLQARIGRLPNEARRVVRAASVFGQTFWRGGIAAILGDSDAASDVEQQLGTLVDAELAQLHLSSCLAKEKEYGFRHALVRDAAYSLLTESDAVTGHRLAAEFLEAAGEHDAAVIGDHFERSGERLRAAGCYLRAAEDSLVRGDQRGALQKVDRGLACQPEGELLGLLHSTGAHVASWLDQFDRMSVSAETALALLRPGSLGWSRAMFPAIAVAIQRNEATAIGQLASLLLTTEPETDARMVHIETLFMVQAGWTLAAPAPMLQAIMHRLAVCVEQAEPASPAIRRWLLSARVGMLTYREPGSWTLVQDTQRIFELCDLAGDQRLRFVIRGHYAELGWLDLGDLAGARQRLLAFKPLMEQSQEAAVVAMCKHVLARVLCTSPDPADWNQAEAVVAPMLAHGAGHVVYSIRAQEVMVRLALLRGHPVEAESQARALMQYFSVIPGLMMPTATLQLRALLTLGRAEEACTVAEQVLATLPILGGAGVFEVEFRLVASEAFHAASNHERAHIELRETLRQIRLRANDIMDPFWKDSYLTRNPDCARAQQLAKEWNLGEHGA